MATSFFTRVAVTVALFYLVADHQPMRLLATFAGFLLMGSLVVHQRGLPP